MVGIFSVEDKVREIFLPKESLGAQDILRQAGEQIYAALEVFEYKRRHEAKERLKELIKTSGIIKINLTSDINYDKEILRFAHSMRERKRYIIDLNGWTPEECYRNIGLIIGHPIVANPITKLTHEAGQVCKRLRQNGTLNYISVQTAEQVQQFKDIVDGFILTEPYALR